MAAGVTTTAATTTTATGATVAGTAVAGASASTASAMGTAALADTAINGGSLKDNLEAGILNALVQTGHMEASSYIKGLDHNYIAHKIAHAVAGCAATAANKGKCSDGAIGAAVGEIVGEALVDGRDASKLSEAERQKILSYSKIIAGSVVALNNGDVNAAANAAQVAVVNNSLSQPQNTLEAGIRNAILKGDAGELRVLLGEANLSANDVIIARRALAAIEKVGSNNAKLMAEKYGVDCVNRVHHIFSNHRGPIGDALIKKSGSVENAVIATQKAVDALKLTKEGNYPVSVNVNGINITVRVHVKDGIARIGTILKM